MGSVSAELVASWQVGAGLAECPVWIGSAGRLAWVDGIGCSYNVLDPGTGRNTAWRLPVKVGSAAPLATGGALVALVDGLALINSQGQLSRLPSPVADGICFNDGKCDPHGRFWVGSRSKDGASGGGALFQVERTGLVRSVAKGFDVCNGLGWSPDAKSFYLIDTVPRLLYRYNYDVATGALGERSILRRFDGCRGKPDGLAVDSAGRLWCAMWDGGGIEILSPEGHTLSWISTPARRPTSCAFGGAELKTLFVTTASIGVAANDPKLEAGGSILAYRVSTAGTAVGQAID